MSLAANELDGPLLDFAATPPDDAPVITEGQESLTEAAQTAATSEVSPELTELNAKISANPLLAAKIQAAETLAKAGDNEGFNRLYSEVSKELGLAPDPEETAALIPNAAGQQPTINLADQTREQEAQWNALQFGIENRHSELTAQKNELINKFNRDKADLIVKGIPEEDAASMSEKINIETWNANQRGFEEFAQDKRISSLVEANCRVDPQLAAVKAFYAHAIKDGVVNVRAPIPYQLQQLAAVGVKVPAAVSVKPAPTITRATMDKLKAMKGPQLSAGKGGAGGGRTGPAVQRNENGMTPQAANYFSALLGQEIKV